MYILGMCTLQHGYVFTQIAKTLAGFEPGSSVPEAGAMSTIPASRGDLQIL
jgi:hypothetical protein